MSQAQKFPNINELKLTQKGSLENFRIAAAQRLQQHFGDEQVVKVTSLKPLVIEVKNTDEVKSVFKWINQELIRKLTTRH